MQLDIYRTSQKQIDMTKKSGRPHNIRSGFYLFSKLPWLLIAAVCLLALLLAAYRFWPSRQTTPMPSLNSPIVGATILRGQDAFVSSAGDVFLVNGNRLLKSSDDTIRMTSDETLSQVSNQGTSSLLAVYNSIRSTTSFWAWDQSGLTALTAFNNTQVLSKNEGSTAAFLLKPANFLWRDQDGGWDQSLAPTEANHIAHWGIFGNQLLVLTADHALWKLDLATFKRGDTSSTWRLVVPQQPVTATTGTSFTSLPRILYATNAGFLIARSDARIVHWVYRDGVSSESFALSPQNFLSEKSVLFPGLSVGSFTLHSSKDSLCVTHRRPAYCFSKSGSFLAHPLTDGRMIRFSGHEYTFLTPASASK